MKKEKRRSIRIPAHLMVLYSIGSADRAINGQANLKDLSDTGMKIISKNPLAEGKTVRFRLAIPSMPKKIIISKALVVEVERRKNNSYLLGLEFKDLKLKQVELIREFIAWSLVKERRSK